MFKRSYVGAGRKKLVGIADESKRWIETVKESVFEWRAPMLFTHGRGPGLARSSKMCEYDLRGNGRLAITAMPYEVEFLQDCLGSDRASGDAEAPPGQRVGAT
jgi:hypothetical protein